MHTTRQTISFQAPFTLNRSVGELPAGDYQIEVDEEAIGTGERSASRRTAIYFYVENARSVRALVIAPSELDSALRRDVEAVAAREATRRRTEVPQ